MSKLLLIDSLYPAEKFMCFNFCKILYISGIFLCFTEETEFFRFIECILLGIKTEGKDKYF
jgi:hypothetical protein